MQNGKPLPAADSIRNPCARDLELLDVPQQCPLCHGKRSTNLLAKPCRACGGKGGGMTAREMILNSAERGNALLLKSEQVSEAAAWIRDHMAIEEHILNRFLGTFQNYTYTGAIAAIDLMHAEALTLRKELSESLNRAQAETWRADAAEHGLRDERSARASLYTALTQVCEILNCHPPDDNGTGCAPLLAELMRQRA